MKNQKVNFLTDGEMAKWKWVLPTRRKFTGLYILRLGGLNAHRDFLKVKGMSVGKGVIRYSKPERIDFKVVEMTLKATSEPTGVFCHNAV